MGLMLPQPRGLGSTNNFAATPGAASNGATSVPADASANTKSAWVELIASTDYPVIGLSVKVSNNSSATAVRRSLFDIGIGGAGSEQVLIANFCELGSASFANQPTSAEYYFPVRVPSGTRLSARHQCSTGSQAARVWVTPHYGNWSEHLTFAGAEMVGADTSTSSLTTITAGSTGSESAWTSVGSTTARTYYAGAACVTMDASGTLSALQYHAEWGFNSTTIGEIYFNTSTAEVIGAQMPSVFQYVVIASGTQLQVRSECNSTAEALQYGIMCLY